MDAFSFSAPVALSTCESRGELAIEGPGLRKERRGGTRGASRGSSRGALSRAGKEGGKDGAGVAYSVLAVESGRSSAMTGGRKSWTLGRKEARRRTGGHFGAL